MHFFFKIYACLRNRIDLKCLVLSAIVLISVQAFSQTRISGIVKGEDSTIIQSATISIKGKKIFTTTDAEGAFSVNNTSISNKDTIFVTAVGWQPQEVILGSRRLLNIYMVKTIDELDQVVVIGYGQVDKKDITGSIATAKIEEMQKAPVKSVMDALAGRVAGVQVSSNDGQPGSMPNIIIRGANSLTQSTAPLYVVDGFPIESSDMEAFNPNDILSISILKDASATAIYGARAANGVVVIQTKIGKVSKNVVSFNGSYGIQSPINKIEMMDGYEFVKYQFELDSARAKLRYLSDGKTLESYRDENWIDWQDEVFQRVPFKDVGISLNGGTSQTQYSISGSFLDQVGIIINSGFKRYQGRASIYQNVSKKIRTGVTFNYADYESKGETVATGSGVLADFTTALMYRTWAYRPVDAAGVDNLLENVVDEDVISINDTRFNPVITSDNDHTKRMYTKFLGTSFLTYKILPGLTFKTTLSGSKTMRRYENFNNSLTPKGSPLNIANNKGVNGTVSMLQTNILSNENTLNYNTTLSGSHKFDILAGFSNQQYSTVTTGFSTQNIENEVLGMSGLDDGVAYSTESVYSDNRLASFFGRLNYDFKNKYYFTGTLRGDGSSKFAPGNRWGVFPSAAVAWSIHKESFMKPATMFSNLKLRLSYGATGNNRVSDFGYLSSITRPIAYSYSFQNGLPVRGSIPASMDNERLGWETTYQTNIGLDVGLLKDRIEVVLDVYNKLTDNLLLNAQMPATTGYRSTFKNIGKLQNRGLELMINTVNIKRDDFSWNSSFNISFNRNQILQLTDGQESLFSTVSFYQAYTRPLYVSEISRPAGMMYGYIFDGLYQTEDFDQLSNGTFVLKADRAKYSSNTKPGDVKYRDLNGDGVIDDRDQGVIGKGQASHFGGLSNEFKYKGFDLSLFLQWSYGNDIYNANRIFFEGNVYATRDVNQYASYINRWTPDAPSTTIPRTGGTGPAGLYSSQFVEDGSYLRLKTVSFGYNFNPKLIKCFWAKTLRLSFAAQNLLTFSSYSGLDPEVSVRNSVLTPGFDFSPYPAAKTMVLSIAATF